MNWDIDGNFGSDYFYTPGGDDPEQVTQTGSNKYLALGVVGNKKTLNHDEYVYYYNYLSSKETPQYLKVALAVVLKADLMRLYGDLYPKYKDPVIEDYSKKLKTLNDADRVKANKEIYNFDYYLTKAPPEYSSIEQNMMSSREDFWVRLRQAEITKSNDEFIAAAIEAESKDIVVNKNEEEQKKLIDVINKYKSEYVKNHLRDYLAASYYSHPVSNEMTEEKSSWELDFRKSIILAVENGSLSAEEGLMSYYNGLTPLKELSTKSEFISKALKGINTFKYKHPMIGLLK